MIFIIKKVILGILILGIVIMLPGYSDVAQVMKDKSNAFILVIDPGHGGMDSGAVAADGTCEKELNLAISKEIAKEASKAGMKVILTRNEDVGLYKEDGVSWNKGDDIRIRKDIIDKSRCDLAITVHLNSFKSDCNVRGAQTFYPKSGDEQMCDKCEQVATKMQEYLVKGLKDGNHRKAMVKNNIYLFKNVNQKTVLVECGFLSNEADLNNLKTPKFQQKIAVYIIKAIKDTCFEKNKKKT